VEATGFATRAGGGGLSFEDAGASLAFPDFEGTESPDFSRRVPEITHNYRACLDAAPAIAREKGSGPMGEEDLFHAVLLSASRSVDEVFESLGTTRGAVKQCFERRVGYRLKETRVR